MYLVIDLFTDWSICLFEYVPIIYHQFMKLLLYLLIYLLIYYLFLYLTINKFHKVRSRFTKMCELYVLIMSRTHFKVNLHSIIAWMSRNSLLETGAKSQVLVSFTNKEVVGLNLVAVTETPDIAPVSSKEFLDIQATIRCRFTLKHARDMIRT